MLLTIFDELTDPRRAQGLRYQMKHLLLFSIFAILSGANSYRSIETYIKENYKKLDNIFKLNWKRSPTDTTIRDVIQRTNKKELEKGFRKYSKQISEVKSEEIKFINMDGKTLRGSFDNFHDKKAIQIFSIFLTEKDIILGHEKIENKKTNEIPIAQKIIKELGLKKCIFTP